ncbi:thioesterase domain-containing protein, partial [Pseudoalteromonas luteoviolacea]|uniref:thioesterase domain-containing protein n=1 Tax=Pseudoalteromonas luteoviolacea TaxID=43657 RepID=UPI00114716D8
VAEIAKHYVTEIKAVQATGPYHLIGYSFGGVIAFEMAKQLENSGESVALLGLLDTVVQTEVLRGFSIDDASIVADVHDTLLGLYDITAQASDGLVRLDFKAASADIAHTLQHHGAEIDQALIEDFMHKFKRDRLLFKQYVATPAQRPITTRLYKAKATCTDNLPTDFGWGELIKAPVSTVTIETDHIGILKADNAKVIVDSLQETHHSASVRAA